MKQTVRRTHQYLLTGEGYMFRLLKGHHRVETCCLLLSINIDIFDVMFISFPAITPAVWYTLC